MKTIKRLWRAYLRRREEKKEEREQTERQWAAIERHMRRNGICLECRGKEHIDLPPWGIVQCPTCGGSGKFRYPGDEHATSI
jgi:hypothetical protein